MKTFVCGFCGKKQPLINNADKDYKMRFCDRKCFGDFRKTLPPEKQPAWRGGYKKYPCVVCGKEKNWRPSDKRYENVFCDPKCRGIYIKQNGLQQREKNHYWNGGKTIDKRGYVRMRAPEHPQALVGGYIREHRFIAMQKIGRLLKPNEDVHHINGIKTDNRPENLEVISHGAHSSHHNKNRKRK